MTKIIGFQDNQAKNEKDNIGKVSPNDTVVLETAEGEKTLRVNEYVRGRAEESLTLWESAQRAKKMLEFSKLPLANGLRFWFKARYNRVPLFAQITEEKDLNKKPSQSFGKAKQSSPQPLKQVTLTLSPNTLPNEIDIRTNRQGEEIYSKNTAEDFLKNHKPPVWDRLTLTIYSDQRVIMASTSRPGKSWTFKLSELQERGYFPLGDRIGETTIDPPQPKTEKDTGSSALHGEKIFFEKKFSRRLKVTYFFPTPFNIIYDLTLPQDLVRFIQKKVADYEGPLPPLPLEDSAKP